MSGNETMITDRWRITEAKALIDLARYVLKAGNSGMEGLALGDKEFRGMVFLLENAKAVIG